jgi:hypothetical protein
VRIPAIAPGSSLRADDDPAADLGGLEAADELAERDLAFVLVAVVARHQQDSRPLPFLMEATGIGIQP